MDMLVCCNCAFEAKKYSGPIGGITIEIIEVRT